MQKLIPNLSLSILSISLSLRIVMTIYRLGTKLILVNLSTLL